MITVFLLFLQKSFKTFAGNTFERIAKNFKSQFKNVCDVKQTSGENYAKANICIKQHQNRSFL